MFFLIGVHSKAKACGTATGDRCPACGRMGDLHVTIKYMTLHVFFIPTFRFGSTYLATCSGCASIMELNKLKGKAVERGRPVEILPEDLRLLQNNMAPQCPRCGQRLPKGSAFCNVCGTKLYSQRT